MGLTFSFMNLGLASMTGFPFGLIPLAIGGLGFFFVIWGTLEEHFNIKVQPT